MSLGPKSNFIPVVYAGTKKKKTRKQKVKLKRGEKNDEKIMHGELAPDAKRMSQWL